MLTDEQKARLNPEQLAIAEKWDQEREARGTLIDKLGEAEKAGDRKRFMEIVEEMAEIGDEDFCEHERSIWSPCAGCDEIERLLNPELFCKICEEAGTDDYGMPAELGEDRICNDCRGKASVVI